jgi:hypothetical protein
MDFIRTYFFILFILIFGHESAEAKLVYKHQVRDGFIAIAGPLCHSFAGTLAVNPSSVKVRNSYNPIQWMAESIDQLFFVDDDTYVVYAEFDFQPSDEYKDQLSHEVLHINTPVDIGMKGLNVEHNAYEYKLCSGSGGSFLCGGPVTFYTANGNDPDSRKYLYCNDFDGSFYLPKKN